MIEHAFLCPYCGERITMLLEPGVEEQVYVEDCEVCCNPITVRFRIDDGAVTDFVAEALQ